MWHLTEGHGLCVNCSVVFDSLQPHELEPARLLWVTKGLKKYLKDTF